MIILKYKKNISFFEESSEIADIIFSCLRIKIFEKFDIVPISVQEAQSVKNKLKLTINEKLKDKAETEFIRLKKVEFDENKISLNTLKKAHKEAFFLIMTYNLISKYIIEGNGNLTLQRQDIPDVLDV